MTTSPHHWRALTTPDRVQYKNPPLVLTVFQIKFSPIWSIGSMSDIGRFQQFVSEDFPLSEKLDGVQLDFQVGPAGGSVNQSEMPKAWQFYDAEDEWKLTLQVDSLTIETRRYDRFEDLIGRINRAITALLTVYKPGSLFRVGLRYVNEIREEALGAISLMKAINPTLLGPLADPSFQSSLSQSTTDFVDIDELGRGLNMRFGRISDGTTVQPIAGAVVPAGPFFLIDIDFYKQFDERRGTKFDVVQVDNIVGEFHSLVWQVWNWSVTSQYQDTLEVN